MNHCTLLDETLRDDLVELTNAVSKSHDTTVDPDSIHYQMLKNLPDSAKDTLLDALNYIWTTGNFPFVLCVCMILHESVDLDSQNVIR